MIGTIIVEVVGVLSVYVLNRRIPKLPWLSQTRAVARSDEAEDDNIIEEAQQAGSREYIP